MAMARRFLLKAEAMMRESFPDKAGRAAYYAAFHSAQAMIYRRSGKALKTHKGVHTEFYRIVRDIPGPKPWGFLRRAYVMKTVTDYGPDPRLTVTEERPRAAIEIARVFVDAVAEVIASAD